MNELLTPNSSNLPTNTEDIAKFMLVGREKPSSAL